MIYQLASGKIIYLSVEAYLSLSDDDIQFIISTGVGESPNNPFHGSVIRNTKIKDILEDEDIESEEESYDNSLDYEIESDQIQIDHNINLDDIPDQDLIN